MDSSKSGRRHLFLAKDRGNNPSGAGGRMQTYEFRIFGAGGGVSLIVHSCHFSDAAAIKTARKFAGVASFEVWRDLERLLPKAAKPVSPRPVSQRATKTSARGIDGDGTTRLYEFKLSSPRHEPLLFAAALMTDDQAADHARALLKRHSGMTGCEIWRGMRLVRQV